MRSKTGSTVSCLLFALRAGSRCRFGVPHPDRLQASPNGGGSRLVTQDVPRVKLARGWARSLTERLTSTFRHHASLRPRHRRALNSARPVFRAVVVATVLTLLCGRSVFERGYVLRLDAVFGPVLPLPGLTFNTPVLLIPHLLGGGAGWRLILLATLFLAAFSPMMVFVRSPWLVQLLAGLIGVLNPWVYDRLQDGQWLVAAGAGALALWVAAFEWLRRRPSLPRALVLAVTTVFIVALDEHEIGLLAALSVCAVVGTGAWRDAANRRWLAVAGLVAAVSMLYGAIPFFFSHGLNSYSAVQHFTRADLVEFRSTNSRRYGLGLNLLGLYGYWGERLGRFPLAKAGVAWWPIGTLLMTSLAVLGGLVRRDRTWLLPAAALGLLVSASTATPLGLSLMVALTRRIPLLAAYREPEKWSALWLLALAVLVPSAVEWSYRKGKGGRVLWHEAAAALAAATIVGVVVPGGAAMVSTIPQSLAPVRYPPAWLAAARFVRDHVPSDQTVLVLPWHMYETLPFVPGAVTGNPAPVVFQHTILTPTDVEIPGQVTYDTSPHHIGKLALSSGTGQCMLAHAIRAAHIHWVVIESAAGAVGNYERLLACSFEVREGSLSSGIVVLYAAH